MRIALLSLFAILAGAAPADAAGRCRAPADATVILRDAGVTLHARTFERPMEGDVTLHTACRRGARRRVLIARTASDVGHGTHAGPFAIGGGYVAHALTRSDHYGSGSTQVVVKRLRDGAQRSAIELPPFSGSCGAGDDEGNGVAELRVNSAGRVAFLLSRKPCLQPLHDEIRGARGQVLDSGAPGSLTGLTVTRTTASWLHAGSPRSAPL